MRLWDDRAVRYVLGNPVLARTFTRKVMSMCDVCQACTRLHTLKAPHRVNCGLLTPMASFAMELFHLPSAKWEEETLDTLIVCVCG